MLTWLYDYVNLDDFWYQCPGSQDPNVDQYGWVTDPARFPAGGSANGISVVANYEHAKLDGGGSSGLPDVQAWSAALQQTGRPMALHLSGSLPNL